MLKKERMSVRVRFAPSPTGALHIGGVRTALYNYLFAKKNGGTFILRIEDTDQKRWVKGAETYIFDALKWLNIPPDESPKIGGNYGPYKQSERNSIYREYIKQLLDSGGAYYAFDTPESLEEERKKCQNNQQFFAYNYLNRARLDNSLTISKEETKRRVASGKPYVIRFKIPENKTIVMNDLIRGMIKVNTSTLDDKVLFKSEGLPTYHFANVVDDYLMKITHVIRGEEWLPSLPLHAMLYEAFGWQAPQFAHLALILKPAGKGKLSKRDAIEGQFPIFPLSWENSKGYREAGYFPEAVINLLALLGWNPGTDQEFFSLEELIQCFDFKNVGKSGVRFSKDKAIWFNHHYLQQYSAQALLEEYKKNLPPHHFGDDILVKMINFVKERSNFPKDLVEQSRFFFNRPVAFPEKAYKKVWKEDSESLMGELKTIIDSISDFSSDHLRSVIREWGASKEIGLGKIMQPLRLALVGEMKGPDLFEIMSILGKEEIIKRIQYIIHYKK